MRSDVWDSPDIFISLLRLCAWQEPMSRWRKADDTTVRSVMLLRASSWLKVDSHYNFTTVSLPEQCLAELECRDELTVTAFLVEILQALLHLSQNGMCFWDEIMKVISLLTLYIEKTQAYCRSDHCTVELRLMWWAAIFSHVEVRSKVFHLAKILMIRVWQLVPDLSEWERHLIILTCKKMITWVLCRQWYLQAIKAPDHEFGWCLCCLGGSWVWRASPTLEGISWRFVLFSRVLTNVVWIKTSISYSYLK